MKINTLYNSKVTSAKGRKIEYIVIHYTAGTTSKAGAALNTANYFRTSNVEGSADYVVDDEDIYLCNADIKNSYSWAVGGSRYQSMTTSAGGKYYGRCTNKNSISVEICSNKINKKSLLAADTDWYFTNSALKLTAELVRQLMSDYGIGIDNVIMHHHVTGKVCPNPFCVNESRLAQWENFKAMLTESDNKEDDEMVETGTMTVNGKNIKIDKIVKEGVTFIKLRGLENAGFNVGYDVNTKNLSLDNAIQDLNVTANGEEKTVRAVNLDGFNYCKLRDVAEAVGNVDVDYKDNTVILITK